MLFYYDEFEKKIKDMKQNAHNLLINHLEESSLRANIKFNFK